MKLAHRAPISAAIAAFLGLAATGSSLATPSTEDLQKVRLYGNVTIAEDSVQSWGPWTEFEEPAAGPQATAQASTGGRTDPYRPLPVINTPAILGFGVFLTDSANANAQINAVATLSADLTPYNLTADIISAADPSSELSAWPLAIRGQTTALNTGESTWLGDTGTLNLTPGDFWFNYSSVSESVTPYVFLDLYPGGWYYDPQQVQATFYSGSSYAGESSQGTWGVIGTPTPAADLSSLRSRGVTASYIGYALDERGINPSINMSVNFGNSTFTLVSNNSSDGAVRTETSTSGATLLKGQVGYTATGTVSGVYFNSTNITSADEASISGKVRGAFYGPAAAAAGGVSDITKNGARYTAPFLAVQPQYYGDQQQVR